MARIDKLSNYLTDIADSIRFKKGTQELIPASTFDTEIRNLPSGGEVGKPVLVADLTVEEDVQLVKIDIPEQYKDYDEVNIFLDNVSLSVSDWIYFSVNKLSRANLIYTSKASNVKNICIPIIKNPKLYNNWYYGVYNVEVMGQGDELNYVTVQPYALTSNILAGSKIRVFVSKGDYYENV